MKLNKKFGLTVIIITVLMCALSGCAEQVATVTDYANVTKDRSENYKSVKLKPSLAVPKEISKEACSETYRIP